MHFRHLLQSATLTGAFHSLLKVAVRRTVHLAVSHYVAMNCGLLAITVVCFYVINK